MLPYMIRSEITVSMVGVVSYYQLLEMYSKEMQKKIQPLNPALLNESVFLFEVSMSPENQTWK